MALSVIGAGVGRTGTLSLKLALERLGFAPCYHMLEVFEDLGGRVPLWDRAADGDDGQWDEIFAGYKSAVDFPASAFYRELAARYPDAKIILTTRDTERWYRSFEDTIRHALTDPLPEELAAWGRMTRKVILDRVFDGSVDDKAHVLARYEQHNEAVKRTIPPERLLVYQVAEGWEPLCRFLDVPVPEEPFPQVNTTDEWLERGRSRFSSEATNTATVG